MAGEPAKSGTIGAAGGTMRRRTLAVTVVGVIAATGVLVAAQARRSAPPAAAGWTVPRLSDGRPDLQGVWENNSATPLERPREFANKPRLTDDELEALKRKAGALFGPEADAVFGDALYLALLDETRSRQLGAT